MRGQEFELLSYGHCWGEQRVSFFDRQGHVCSMPADWTSAAPPDPFVLAAAGRSFFRIKDLLALAALLRELSTQEAECKDDCAKL